MSNDQKIPAQFIEAVKDFQIAIQKAVIEFLLTVDSIKEVKTPSEIVAITEASRALGIAIFSMVQHVEDKDQELAIQELLHIVEKESSNGVALLMALKTGGIIDDTTENKSDTPVDVDFIVNKSKTLH